MPRSWLALAALLPTAVLLTAACGTTGADPGAAYGTPSAATSTPSASGSVPPTSTAAGAPMVSAKAVLTVRKTKIGYVLATSTGLTVYWYGKDVKGGKTSACTGGCATAWPAVTGTPAAAPGVTLSGKLGTITRPGGIVQATYNGYPLYTYSGDSAPGLTGGNGVGGVWHVITGAMLSTSSTAGGGAGY